MRTRSRGEVSGIVGMASAVLEIIGLVVEYSFGLLPPGDGSFLYNAVQFLFFLAMIGYLFMVVALLQSRVTGESAFGKISLSIFIASLVTLIVANIVKMLTGNSNFFLFPVGALLFPIGGLLTGISIALAKRWDGWQRFAPLVQGVYFTVWLAILVVTNHLTFLGETLGQVLWFLTSLALFTKSRTASGREQLPGAIT